MLSLKVCHAQIQHALNWRQCNQWTKRGR